MRIDYFCNQVMEKGVVVSYEEEKDYVLVVPYNGENIAGILLDDVVEVDFLMPYYAGGVGVTAKGGKVRVLESGTIILPAKPKWNHGDLLTINNKGQLKRSKRHGKPFAEIMSIDEDFAHVDFNRRGI